MVAARCARAGEGRADRPRRAGSIGRGRDPDADDSAGGSLARKRSLRGLRQGDAAHQRPPRARHALWADQRGNGDGNLPRLCQQLSRVAAEPLSHPVEVPRRGASAVRRAARPRVSDEGCLFFRHRRGGGARLLQQDVRGLYAHLQADGADRDSDARRYRTDRRRSQPRVPCAGGDRRIRVSSAIAKSSIRSCPARMSTTIRT